MVDELTALALDYGISTFLLGSDDPAAIEAFGREVVPAIRAAVTTERAMTGVKQGLFAPLYVRERRKPGISYDSLPDNLAASAIEPGDVGYGAAKNNYIRGGNPGLVLRPADAGEVAQALTWTRSQGAPDAIPLGVRSGGMVFLAAPQTLAGSSSILGT